LISEPEVPVINTKKLQHAMNAARTQLRSIWQNQPHSRYDSNSGLLCFKPSTCNRLQIEIKKNLAAQINNLLFLSTIPDI
jgi:hypothetical protein